MLALFSLLVKRIFSALSTSGLATDLFSLAWLLMVRVEKPFGALVSGKHRAAFGQWLGLFLCRMNRNTSYLSGFIRDVYTALQLSTISLNHKICVFVLLV